MSFDQLKQHYHGVYDCVFEDDEHFAWTLNGLIKSGEIIKTDAGYELAQDGDDEFN